ncbi:hypothetical protein [Sphingomonas zeae]|jgi:hypothetical protein
MEVLLEVVLQFVGEIALQLVIEFLFELGFRNLGAPFSRPASPLSKTLGYILLGGVAGGMSLLVVPHLMIQNGWLRMANLVITPVTAGGIMWFLARKKVRKNAPLVALDRFGYAFFFALAMSSVRFLWAS